MGSDDQLAKYDAWILEIDSRRARLAASRPGYQRFFAAVLVVSPAGFLWNPWVGAAAVVTGLLFCVFGFYALAVRDGDYARELAVARANVNRIRGC